MFDVTPPAPLQPRDFIALLRQTIYNIQSNAMFVLNACPGQERVTLERIVYDCNVALQATEGK